MAAPREYELVLMLDPGRDAPARDAVAAEAKGQIEAKGTLKDEKAWGLRKLAYEIEKRNEADYRWFRFEATNELLEELDHNLKIADGVLRFRVFKVDPDTPTLVPPTTNAPAAAPTDRPAEHTPPPPAPPAEAPPAAEPAPAPTEAPPAAEPAPAPTEAPPAPEPDDSAA